ncbi:MAG TPA: tetratricopeptide repeat protein, partial [Alphaproteobacteria bacterium]|nr:tetratricopeptide repeat protein [Alphaproteobacteria bacterium]
SVLIQLADAMKIEATGNYKEAFQIFKKLADIGDPTGQYRVGFYYWQGLGVEQDNHQAFEWFNKAAETNYPSALVARGKMLITGSGTPKDPIEGVVSLMAASTFGEKEGLALTCLAYDQYLKDPYNSYYWCLLSSKHLSNRPGLNDKVADLLLNLQAKLTDVQIQSIQAKVMNWHPVEWQYPTNLFDK